MKQYRGLKERVLSATEWRRWNSFTFNMCREKYVDKKVYVAAYFNTGHDTKI